MKTLTNIKKEKPTYFVCVNGSNEFESYSITECKKFLCDLLKSIKDDEIENTCDYYIGMYSITID